MHSVQGTAMTLASYIGAPFEEISFWVAGLNPHGLVLDFNRKGEDAYPLLWRAMEDPAIYARDRVRWDLLRYFGAFVSESSTHSSEYHPYFRRRQS
jgi:alpha-galactosidase